MGVAVVVLMVVVAVLLLRRKRPYETKDQVKKEIGIVNAEVTGDEEAMATKLAL